MMRISFLIIALLLLAGCSDTEGKLVIEDKETKNNSAAYQPEASAGEEEAGFKTIDSAEAIELIKTGEVVILDVRSEGYSEGHIKDAQNIPLKELGAKEAELDKEGTYLIVCKVGKTSEMASRQLAESGFANIYNLAGGMDSWTGEVVN